MTDRLGPGARAIDRIFNASVLARLERIRRAPGPRFDSAGDRFRRRHEALAAVSATTASFWRALRSAWAEYLDAADACGLLKDTELVSALTGDDDDAFRAALAECTTAWYLTAVVGLNLLPKPDGKTRKNIDFRATGPGLEFDVEVKAPHVPIMNQVFCGSDAEAIVASIKKAGAQFQKGHPNLLVLVPNLRTPINMDRDQLVNAAIGDWAISVPISLELETDQRPSEMVFVQNGKLARLFSKPDGTTSTDHTRISAVMSIEEIMFPADDWSVKLEHRVFVVHNPFAATPLHPSVLGDVPQLVPGEGGMHWTDGAVES